MLNAAKGSTTTEKQAIEVLVDALERLSMRITRDLNVEAGEGAAPEDPVWATTLSQFVDFAEECLTVLDDPRVTESLGVAA